MSSRGQARRIESYLARLSESNDFETALPWCRSLVDLHERLTATGYAPSLRAVSNAQTSLGVVLSGLGRAEESLAHHREALRLLGDAAAYRYERAVALLNVGGRLSELGHREEGLARTRESLELARGLDMEETRHRTVLVQSLHNIEPNRDPARPCGRSTRVCAGIPGSRARACEARYRREPVAARGLLRSRHAHLSDLRAV